MSEPADLGDLITVTDGDGALHLAAAYMYYPTYQPDTDVWPNDGFHVAYFSDHPGCGVRRADVRVAVDELLAGVWYLAPIRDGLAETLRYRCSERTQVAIEQALATLEPGQFLTAHTGEPCPRAGRWILRGADRAIDIDAGVPMPGHRYFAEHPPQWTRWDLPLPG